MDLDQIGTRGAPRHTLEDLHEALKGAKFSELIATFVTDWQDQRGKARYALLARWGRHAVLTMDAFGPGFGKEGDAALSELVGWLQGQGVVKFYETVLPPSEYSALFAAEPDEALTRIMASANPADPTLYTKNGYSSRM
jgi:hypothetical protein